MSSGLNKLTGLFVVTLILAGCTSPIEAPRESEIIGLASPVTLQNDTTEIVTADYFKTHSLIDSVQAPSGLKAELSSNDSLITLSGSMSQPLGILTIGLKVMPMIFC